MLFEVLFCYLSFCSFCVVSWPWSGDKFDPLSFALNSIFIKCDHARNLTLDTSGTDVYFYDFQNNIEKDYPISQAADKILKLPTFNKKKHVIVFVGGFKSHINRKQEQKVRDAFIDHPHSYLLIIDHSAYTNNRHGYKQSYERSVMYVHHVGKALGRILAQLKLGGVRAENIHCIGHSLGSQMLAQAGETFTKLTKQKIRKITALDPAGPCFSNGPIEDQIRSGVAEYVEVFHCNAGALGSSSVLADADFFVNKKGQSQPNCGNPWIPDFLEATKSAKCNHRVCLDIYLSTLKNPNYFLAVKCDSYELFKGGKCIENEITLAGFWNTGGAKGVYYLSTEGLLL